MLGNERTDGKQDADYERVLPVITRRKNFYFYLICAKVLVEKSTESRRYCVKFLNNSSLKSVASQKAALE